MQNLKKILKNKKGFTLVELMVVVAILGILVAVAVPVYGNVTENAKLKTCESNKQTIKSAVTTALANGETAASLQCTVGGTTDGTSATLKKYLDASAMKCGVKPEAGYVVAIDANNVVTVTHSHS